jgi:hypothetical protein
MPDGRESKPTPHRAPPRDPTVLREQLAESARGLPSSHPTKGRRDAVRATRRRDNSPLDNSPLQERAIRQENDHADESGASAVVIPADDKPDGRQGSEGRQDEFEQWRPDHQFVEGADQETGPHNSAGLDEFPTPMGCPNASLPRGPDFLRKKRIVEAMEAQRNQRRRRSGRGQGEEVHGNGGAREKLLARGRQLQKRYRWEEKLDKADDLDPRLFADWVTVLQLSLAPSTRRLYRLAAEAVIRTWPHEGMDEAIATLTGTGPMETSARGQYKQTLAKNAKLSEDRAERMPIHHYRKLSDGLRKMSGSKVIETLEDWMVAGLTTGVLPGEWPLASVEECLDIQGRRRAWLHVVNAGSNGIHRSLDISTYNGETLEAIGRMVKRSEKWALEGTTARHRSEVATALDRACADLFPTQSIRYSLHSFRDQFIANMKAVLKDDAEVSALIGQLIVKTEPAHHANQRTAWARDDITEVPKPLERQVAKFRKYRTMYEERLMYRNT